MSFSITRRSGVSRSAFRCTICGFTGVRDHAPLPTACYYARNKDAYVYAYVLFSTLNECMYDEYGKLLACVRAPLCTSCCWPTWCWSICGLNTSPYCSRCVSLTPYDSLSVRRYGELVAFLRVTVKKCIMPFFTLLLCLQDNNVCRACQAYSTVDLPYGLFYVFG
jgi:hypothetical protein